MERKKKALLLDDNEMYRQFMKSALEEKRLR